MFLYSQSNQKYKYKECMVAQTQKNIKTECRGSF